MSDISHRYIGHIICDDMPDENEQSFISNELYKFMLMKYTICNMEKVGIFTDEEKYNTYMWFILNKYDYQTVTISYLLKIRSYKSKAALCICL